MNAVMREAHLTSLKGFFSTRSLGHTLCLTCLTVDGDGVYKCRKGEEEEEEKGTEKEKLKKVEGRELEEKLGLELIFEARGRALTHGKRDLTKTNLLSVIIKVLKGTHNEDVQSLAPSRSLIR